jgi:glycosyltransferase involved in cell wall biosynthesis
VFNGERYLRESLDSIVAQTYPDIEILVMDDASTDGTPEIIASYGDRVTCFRQPRNRGQFENVNDGIARARGEYIAVYHSDDVYEPEIVAREAAYLRDNPAVGAVFCQDIFLDGASREVGRLTLPPEARGGRPLDYPVVLNALLKYKNSFLRGPSSIVRAAVYADVGPYRGEVFGIASDLEMWVRIARRHPVAVLPEFLFRYRYGHENLSKEYAHLRTEQERFFKVMDHYLDEGDRRHATAEAMAAYEAHRAEDRLMRAVNHYILGQRGEARALLGEVKPRHVLASARVQRGRLLILLLVLKGLVRLPRIRPLAGLFYRRWHGGGELPRSC